MPPKTSTERSQDCRARKKLAEEEKKATRRQRDKLRKQAERARKKEQQQQEQQRQQQQEESTMNSHHAAQQGHATPNRREHREHEQYETPSDRREREEQYRTPQDRRPRPRQPRTMPEMRILQQHHPVLDLFRDQNQVALQQNQLALQQSNIVATLYGACPVEGFPLTTRHGGAPYSDVRHDHRTDGWNQRNDGRGFDDGDWHPHSSDHDDGLRGPPTVHRSSLPGGYPDHDGRQQFPPPALNPGSHNMYGTRSNHWGATAQSGSSLEVRDHGLIPPPPPPPRRYDSFGSADNSSLSGSVSRSSRGLRVDTAASPVARRNPHADENSPPFLASPPFHDGPGNTPPAHRNSPHNEPSSPSYDPTSPMYQDQPKSPPDAKPSAKKTGYDDAEDDIYLYKDHKKDWTCKRCGRENYEQDANCSKCSGTERVQSILKPSADSARAVDVEQQDDEDEGPPPPEHFNF